VVEFFFDTTQRVTERIQRCRRWRQRRRSHDSELIATRRMCSQCSTRHRFTSSRYWQTATDGSLCRLRSRQNSVAWALL